MRAPAALVLAAAVLGASTPAAADVSTRAPRATLVQVLRGGRQALILDRVSGEYGVVKVGDTIHGLRVAEIEPDQIVLATPTPPERYFVLPLVEAAAPAPAAPPAGGPAPPNPTTRPVDPIDDVANPADPANPGSDVATGKPSDRGSAPSASPEQPEPGVVVPDGLAGDTPSDGDGDMSGEGGDVIDPYSTPPGAGAGEADPSVIDPYGGSAGGGDIPSIIAPPDSRAEPAPEPRPDVRPAPGSGRDARRPEARPDARPDAPTPAAPPDLAPDADLGDLDAEGGLDAEPPVDPRQEDIDDNDAPGPAARVKTVKPTEVQPGASARTRAPEEPAQPLSRRELDWALSDFAALSRQIRIERADGGGVRIVELERGSFLARLGIKRGDVVRRVAGHPIDNVDQAAAAYAALADARDVVVELERRGTPLRLRYRLTR